MACMAGALVSESMPGMSFMPDESEDYKLRAMVEDLVRQNYSEREIRRALRRL